jgi:hypothetical protein
MIYKSNLFMTLRKMIVNYFGILRRSFVISTEGRNLRKKLRKVKLLVKIFINPCRATCEDFSLRSK